MSGTTSGLGNFTQETLSKTHNALKTVVQLPVFSLLLVALVIIVLLVIIVRLYKQSRAAIINLSQSSNTQQDTSSSLPMQASLARSKADASAVPPKQGSLEARINDSGASPGCKVCNYFYP